MSHFKAKMHQNSISVVCTLNLCPFVSLWSLRLYARVRTEVWTFGEVVDNASQHVRLYDTRTDVNINYTRNFNRLHFTVVNT